MAQITAVVRIGWLVGRRAVASILLVGAAACVSDESALIVYTSLPGDLVEEAGRSFEVDHPEADVRFVKLDDAAAFAQLAAERGDPRADVWWGASDEALARAAAEGLLAGQWRVTMESPLVLAFHPDRVSLGRAPRDWRDLRHPRWRGELVLLDPELNAETRAFLLGLMVQEARRTGVLDAGFDWLLSLDAATGLYAGDLGGLESLLRTGDAALTILPLHVARELEERSLLTWRLAEGGAPALRRGVGTVARGAQPELAAEFVAHLARTDMIAASMEATGWLPPAAYEGSMRPGDIEERLTDLQLWQSAADTVLAEGERWMRHWAQQIRGRGAPTVR